MKIYAGSDHAGLTLKNILIAHLEKKGYQVEDLGTYTSDSCDYPDYAHKVAEKVLEDREKVIAAGGLKIVGTERHDSRRIDNQLRGRSGRQGDIGESRFYLSLEDNLMKLFGSDRVQNLAAMLNMPEDMPLEMKMLTSTIENAQKNVTFMKEKRKRK